MTFPLKEITRPRPAFWREFVVARAATTEAELHMVLLRSEGGPLPPSSDALEQAVSRHLRAAEMATEPPSSLHRRIGDWWSGASVDRAWINLHAAELLMSGSLSPEELEERIPAVIAHLKLTLNADDERRIRAIERLTAPPTRTSRLRARSPLLKSTVTGQDQGWLRRREAFNMALRWAYMAADEQYARVRSLRNILICWTVLLTLLATTIVLVGRFAPHLVPLCFDPNAANETTQPLACPTGTESAAGTTPGLPWDAGVVALFGLVGGALTAAIAVQKIKGTSTPYAIPLALAAFKLPFGALGALIGLLFIQGQFVPGLSALDKPAQILAYAVVLGSAQQIATRLVDQRAQSILSAVPSADIDTEPTARTTTMPSVAPTLPPRRPRLVSR